MQLIAYGLAWFLTHMRGERGQDLIEYSLLGGLLALALMAALVAFGALTGAIDAMGIGIGRCIDWDPYNTCDPF
jgi:Flp pilus assembly pilin Flp